MYIFIAFNKKTNNCVVVSLHVFRFLRNNAPDNIIYLVNFMTQVRTSIV